MLAPCLLSLTSQESHTSYPTFHKTLPYHTAYNLAADEAKGKYFKIEARATAPPAAHWSSENVKKRARKDRDRERGERKRGRPTGSQPIRRSLAAPRRCFAGDELRLQCEGVLGLGGSRRILGDSRARVWAQGFGDAGSIQFWGYGALTSRVTDFTVVEGNVERLGYIYAGRYNMPLPEQ